MKRTIGLRIREARKAAGLTQDVLAERLDRTVESLSNLERGKSLPSLEALGAIAEVLGLRLSDLVADIDAETMDRERVELEGRVMAAIRTLDKKQLRIAVKQIEAFKDYVPE